MYKLVIKSKTLIDEKWAQAECSLNSDDEVLRDGIIIKSTVDSFEQTVVEAGELWVKSFEALNAIGAEIEIDVKKIAKDKKEKRQAEKVAADEAAAAIAKELKTEI